jgi:hypothetical protein
MGIRGESTEKIIAEEYERNDTPYPIDTEFGTLFGVIFVSGWPGSESRKSRPLILIHITLWHLIVFLVLVINDWEIKKFGKSV